MSSKMSVDEAKEYVREAMSQIRESQMQGHAVYASHALEAASALLDSAAAVDKRRWEFAGRAMQGILASDHGSEIGDEFIVIESVMFADMLIEKLQEAE